MSDKKPVIEVRTVATGDDWRYYEEVEIYLDGEKIAEGFYGGEPEDNLRYRTYSWVDDAIKELGEKLGAKVIFTDALEDGDAE